MWEKAGEDYQGCNMGETDSFSGREMVNNTPPAPQPYFYLLPRVPRSGWEGIFGGAGKEV